MAFDRRQRREAYDNISAGNATGVERTFTDTVSPQEIYGGGKNTSTSTEVADSVGNTNIAAGTSVSDSLIENVVGGTAGYNGENVG